VYLIDTWDPQTTSCDCWWLLWHSNDNDNGNNSQDNKDAQGRRETATNLLPMRSALFWNFCHLHFADLCLSARRALASIPHPIPSSSGKSFD